MSANFRQQRAVIVIPVRMSSTRFPGKPLAVIGGKTMIERVFSIAKASKKAEQVVVATDSEELREAVSALGAQVVMTSSSCATGTDRVFEAVQSLGREYEVICSLQGDAVLTPPWVIDEVIEKLRDCSQVKIATPALLLTGEERKRFLSEKAKGSSSGTMVVFDRHKNALYFSKGLIPYSRTVTPDVEYYRHIGLYVYRRESLNEFCSLPAGRLEETEKLEQLRALEHGIPIRIVVVDYQGRSHHSVDRPEDIVEVEEAIRREGELVLTNEG